MILAAGRGDRMRPLTDTLPKPLLPVGGKPLIVWQIEALVRGGFDDLVINHAWLGSRIEDAIGDGSRHGARIAWSREPQALETAGGIATALPLIQSGGERDEPFVVVSADIHSAFDYATLAPVVTSIRLHFPMHAAHLVLVDNPPWHPAGDMALVDGRVRRELVREPGDVQAASSASATSAASASLASSSTSSASSASSSSSSSSSSSPSSLLTYANIAVFHPRVFAALPRVKALKLFPWAYALADTGRMTGSRYDGPWDNVGTPEQLAALDRRLRDDRERHG